MKKIIFLLIAVLLGPLLWGQDFSFDSPVDDSFESSDFGSDSFQDSGDGSFFSGDSGGLEISGSMDIPITLTPQRDSLKNSMWSFSPEIITNLDYSNGNTDLKVILGAKMDNGETSLNIKESWVRLYLGGTLDLEAGLMKITWGKGDKVHIMDVLNPMDYSQFIEPEYNERKQADLMVRLNMAIGETGRTEFVFLPWFTPDAYAMEGNWLMADTAALQTSAEVALEAYGIAYCEAAGGDGLAALATVQKLSEMEDSFLREENTKTLEYAQGGIRFTHTAGPLDWGVAIIRSFVREPVVKGIDLSSITAASNPHYELTYTPMVMTAQEAALVFKGFNLREEAALTLTRDWDGDDPYLKNSKAEWLFGFDRNIGLNNINLNMQAKGSYLLFTETMGTSDPEYSNRYYNHMIIGSLSDSYLHDTLEISLSGSWNIEDKDFLLLPEIELTFREAVTFALAYHLYEGKSDTTFGQFDDQDNLTLSCRMNF